MRAFYDDGESISKNERDTWKHQKNSNSFPQGTW